MGGWNWLDSLLAAVILGSGVAAALKGFIRELISLAAVVAGLAVAAAGYARAAVWFEDLTRSHEVALGAGFLTLFLAVLGLGILASAVSKRLIKAAGVQWADRILGGVVGLIRGVLIDCILLMILVAFAIKPQAVQQSLLAPYVAAGARGIAVTMPTELKSQFRAGFERFRQALISKDKKLTKN